MAGEASEQVAIGWVEQSETHHEIGEAMGFALLNPSY